MAKMSQINYAGYHWLANKETPVWAGFRDANQTKSCSG